MSLVTQSDDLREAFELHNLQTNTSLLDYGLKVGLIERKTNGQMFIELLNIRLMNENQLVWGLLLEIVTRIVVLVSGTGLVKLAIYSEDYESDAKDGIKAAYAFSTLFHQILNYERTSLRTINRLFMSISMIVFSLDSPNTPICEDMKKFKHKIRHKLAIDYYLWCLLFAMDLVLTCSSPYYINLERQFGINSNILHILLSVFCVVQLGHSMQMIGNGRLVPLIAGTPLLFLDAGIDLTLSRGLLLFTYYLGFWLQDWREIGDWNHAMLCDAGICKILSTEKGTERYILGKAIQKFDEWRIEEGLDDDGLYILLDPQPVQQANDPNGGSSDDSHHETSDSSRAQQYVDYPSERVIYLESRNPLLTILAAIILIFLK